ncbi:dihydrofolate reductase-like domain-containing protein [Lactarius hatsudake]|nr:dihydrofolate reductase-like domain-containing protein [Lactarius hatsudake]
MSGPPAILASILGTLPQDVQPGTMPLSDLVPSDITRPYVTLTFAQSIDAKIAGAGSMKMTHWMRTMHDGILIGIGTAVNDNPQLNEHALSALPPPRPLILDPHLRLSPTCKLIINAAKGAGVAPWVISARPPKPDGFFANEDDGERLQQWPVSSDLSLLSSAASGRLVDTLIVTTAPVLVGRNGVGYGEGLEQVPSMSHVTTELLGRDTVVGLKSVSCDL